MGGRGSSSGITRTGATSQLARMSKTGDMPRRFTTDGTREDFDRVFSAVDRYYRMPDEPWLKSHGVQMDDALHTEQYRRYNEATRSYEKTGEYFLTRRVAVLGRERTVVMHPKSPIGVSSEAHEGMLKASLWHALEQAGELDRRQFIRPRPRKRKKT